MLEIKSLKLELYSLKVLRNSIGINSKKSAEQKKLRVFLVFENRVVDQKGLFCVKFNQGYTLRC